MYNCGNCEYFQVVVSKTNLFDEIYRCKAVGQNQQVFSHFKCSCGKFVNKFDKKIELNTIDDYKNLSHDEKLNKMNIDFENIENKWKITKQGQMTK